MWNDDVQLELDLGDDMTNSIEELGRELEDDDEETQRIEKSLKEGNPVEIIRQPKNPVIKVEDDGE